MPFRIAIAAFALALSARPACAQTATPERPVRIAGYVQPQYEQLDRPEERHDRVFFRRAVLTVDGQPAPDWFAAFIIDFGPVAGGGRLIVKDAYVQYRGWHERGVTLAVGNQKTPFSRSTIASSVQARTHRAAFHRRQGVRGCGPYYFRACGRVDRRPRDPVVRGDGLRAARAGIGSDPARRPAGGVRRLERGRDVQAQFAF